MIRQMSGAEIAFNLKDEKGDVVPVEIDGIEEEVCERTPTPEKKVSIQQRVLKARNSEQQMSIIAVRLVAVATNYKHKNLNEIIHK
ncbi:unnamed protein product [Dimorphilus gyrociliatus]|uniref:Uncharacterized protein n=1 Tax=Dimorphilus gyrociliatus TaxID=2664684 RepID=A0A7I8W9N3_9ANNE|nr:unnamed protein product [Dimorphilus gyrociliatus]